jgi:hypothetical protein
MARKLFSKAALASLLLCAAIIWWWVGSSGQMTQVSLKPGGDASYEVVGANGKVALTRSNAQSANGGELRWSTAPVAADTLPPKGNSSLRMPMWALVGAFAFLPMAWVGTKVRKGKKSEKKH